MKVTATTPIKHGTKDGIEEFAPGESFEVDKKTADKLVANGDAITGSPAKAAKDAEAADKDRLAEEQRITEANAQAERERQETADKEALGSL